jgi:hypothetical protein
VLSGVIFRKKGFLIKMATANKEPTDTAAGPKPLKNPRRVAAAKLNRAKRKGLTAAGKEKLRQTAFQNQPWRYSTGPKTPKGKARSALNNKVQQKGPLSVRELRAEMAGLRQLALEMREGRQLLGQ